MFDYAVNLFETMLCAWFLYRCVDQNHRNIILSSVIYIAAQFLFITIVNQYSPSESVLMIVIIAMQCLYLKAISDKQIGFILFYGSLTNILIGLSNLLLCSTICFAVYHTVNYYTLMQTYYVPVVITAQILHVVMFLSIVRYRKKHELELSNNEYIVAFGLVFLVGIISICFEAVEMEFENSAAFLLAGIYCTGLFAIVSIVLVNEIHARKTNEAKLELNNQILKSQMISSDKIMESRKEVLKMRHDLKHFIRILSKEQRYDSDENVQDFIQKYTELTTAPVPIQTKIPVVNLALNQAMEESHKRGIDFVCTLNITHDIDVEDSDLYLILSNLLDNAIEHIGLGKQIRVTMRDINQMFMIQIMNSVNEQLLDENHEFIHQGNIEKHGFGIYTVRQLCQKYYGFLSYSQFGTEFTATVLFPILSEKTKQLLQKQPL